MENVANAVIFICLILYLIFMSLVPMEDRILTARERKREKHVREEVEETLGQMLLFSNCCLVDKRYWG